MTSEHIQLPLSAPKCSFMANLPTEIPGQPMVFLVLYWTCTPTGMGCFQAWATQSQSISIIDTLAWFPIDFTMPELSFLDHATVAIIDLSTALRSLVPSAAIHGTSAQPHPPIQSVVTALHELVQLYSAPLPLPAALQWVVSIATHPSLASLSNPSDLPNISFPATSAIASDPTQPAPPQLTLHSANSATLTLNDNVK